jgi:hypothetical protein
MGVGNETDTAALRRPAVTELLREHIRLALSVCLIAVALFNMLAVSRFDLITMKAVLSVANRTSVLSAAAVDGATIAIVLALVNQRARRWVLRGIKTGASLSEHLITAGALVFGVPLLVSIVNLSLLVAIAVVQFAVFLWRRRARQTGDLLEDGRIKVTQDTYEFLNFVLLLLAGSAILGQDPPAAHLRPPHLARRARSRSVDALGSSREL